ncbi:MAG: TIM-barrel domain-containing protein [Planctomycetota bacterium]
MTELKFLPKTGRPKIIEREPAAITFCTVGGLLRLEFVRPGAVRVRYTHRSAFNDTPSLAVIASAPVDADSSLYTVQEEEDQIVVVTERIRLRIDRERGRLTWCDAKGNVLLREAGREIQEVDVEVSVFEEDTKITHSQSVDGARARATDIRKRVDRKAYQTRLHFDFAGDEAIYGFGSHEEGILNYRGQNQHLYQQNFKAVVPMMVSTKGYGILNDTYGLSTFYDDAQGSYWWTDVDDEMDTIFIVGPEFDQIVATYRELTGTAPLLPRWAYGYCQSKERYKTQQELLDIVKGYRDRRLPLDCIILDWHSWVGELWGQKSFDPERFPDPTAMCEQIHAMDAKLMISIWPIMRNEGENQIEMRAARGLLGNDATYDAMSASARGLYWKQAYEGLFKYGIDGWWCDCTEPFEADWEGSFKPDPWQRLLINVGEAKDYLDPEYVNAYSLMHSQGIYEGQRRDVPEKRVVNLTRSAYHGQQRYGTITWSGDTSANWDVLKAQIAAGLNFSVTGCPYWTSDIGGFFTVDFEEGWFLMGQYPDGVDDLGYREIYVRWFQYGAMLPMFRSHGTNTPREIWRFGEPGDVWYDTLVSFSQLRYRLMPYLYSLAGRITHRHDTMLRLLAFDFRDDPSVFDIDDQFMCGPSLMVCPVTKPMYHGPHSTPLEGVAATRSVYLPAGTAWYDFWTGERYEGGQTITADAPLERMPIYVPAGTILPMGPVIEHTGEGVGKPIELRVYPGADAAFDLYHDAGDGYDYEDGAFDWTALRWNDASGQCTIGPTSPAPASPREQAFHVTRVGPGRGVGVVSSPNPGPAVGYSTHQADPHTVHPA